MEEKMFIKARVESTLQRISSKAKGVAYSSEVLQLVKPKELLKFVKTVVSSLD
jgi:hypothetical protein